MRICNSPLHFTRPIRAWVLGLLCAWLPAALGQTAAATRPVADSGMGFETLAEWRQACAELPSNRLLRGRFPSRDQLALKSFAPVSRALDLFLDQSRTNALAERERWIANRAPGAAFYDTERGWFSHETVPFQPFAQKQVVPNGAEVFVRADLHGDIHTLLANLQWLNAQGYLRDFTIVKPNFWMLFLGDYTDRGAYGVEVIYTLLRLKLANPERVIMARGNHEDLSLIARYGFLAEGRSKYGNAFDARKITRAYDFLPVVVYLGSGTDFVQCNHGGMEPGYDPRPLLASPGETRFDLIGPLQQRRVLTENPRWPGVGAERERALAERFLQDFQPQSPIEPSVLGFMWNDFTVVAEEPQFGMDPGRAFIYGREASREILRRASGPTHTVQAVLRGHQHAGALNPMMRRLMAGRGAFRHWQAGDSLAALESPIPALEKVIEHAEVRSIPSGSVWTFNVAPDSVYGMGCGFDYDAFGLLTTAERFADWRMKVVTIPVAK